MTAYLSDYEGLRCLVTGHTGFKGSWMSAWLDLLGAEVTGFALAPDSTQDLFRQARIADRTDSVFGDIRDLSSLQAVIERSEPEIVFHLAAQSLVRRSHQEPVETFDTNVMGTVNLLEAARAADSIRAIVVVTSDKSYANPGTGRAVTEDDPMGGADPYSASKGAAELATAAYRSSFFDDSVLLASARAGNAIGAGDEAEDRLVPDIVRSLRSARPVVLRNPASTRPWQHVLEPLRGYLMLGARLLGGDATAATGWNFGPSPDETFTVADVARRLVDAWGSGEIVEQIDPDAVPEATLLQLDSRRAREVLGYDPVLNLDAAIEMTVSGYRRLFDGDATDVLDRQIDEYTALLP